MSDIFKPKEKFKDVLLPCPFCGEAEEIYLEAYEHGEKTGKRWRIVCTSCMAQIDRGTDQTPGILTELWNKRAKSEEAII